MATFRQSIIDNNLLRKLTKNGGYDKYTKYWNEITERNLIDSNTQLFITIGGSLEFLSQSLPLVEPRNPDYFHDRANKILAKARSEINYDEIQQLRADLLTEIENILKETHAYSKSKISTWIGEQRKYTDVQLQDMVFNIIKSNLWQNKGRNVIRNRIALDRTLLFRWPSDFEEWLYPAYMMDLHHAYEMGIGYGSMRGLEFVWKNFCKEMRKKIQDRRKKLRNSTPTEREELLKEPLLGTMPLEQIEENIFAITKAAGFAATGDFLDVEAIHYLAVGRFRNDNCEPILFATQDPVDKFLVRIGLFRSLYMLSYQMIKKDDSAVPPAHPGVALIFDEHIQIEYMIPIAEVDPLLTTSGDILLGDWLQEMKTKFAVSI